MTTELKIARDPVMGGLSNDELKTLMVQAMALNAQHPDFVDWSAKPDFDPNTDYEGRVWFDPKAEHIFDAAVSEMVRRSGGNITLEFPEDENGDIPTIEVRLNPR